MGGAGETRISPRKANHRKFILVFFFFSLNKQKRFNYGVLQSEMGRTQWMASQGCEDTCLKAALTAFRAAAGAFASLALMAPSGKGDMAAPALAVLPPLLLGQAQECFVAKAMTEGRKASLVSDWHVLLAVFSPGLSCHFAGCPHGHAGQRHGHSHTLQHSDNLYFISSTFCLFILSFFPSFIPYILLFSSPSRCPSIMTGPTAACW